MSRISQSWPTSLQHLIPAQHKKRNFLGVFVKHPVANLDLRSADHLRRSLLATSVSHWNSDSIGHVMIGWSCPTAQTKWHQGFVSQAGDVEDQYLKMLATGWGLSVIPMVLNDGYLNDPKENNDEFIEPSLNLSVPSLSFLLVEVSATSCNQFLNFVETFSGDDRPQKPPPYKNFGLTLNPESLEGGACNSFAVAALNKAEFFGDASRWFRRELRLPHRLLGFKKNRPRSVNSFSANFSNEKSVSFFQLVTSSWGASPKVAESSDLAVSIFDTEMILLNIRTLMENFRRENPRLSLNSNLFHRYVKSGATFWGEPSVVELNHQFDFFANQVVEASDRLYQKLRSNGYEFAAIKVGRQVGLIAVGSR